MRSQPGLGDADVLSVALDADALAAYILRGNQRAARAGERIKNEPASRRRGQLAQILHEFERFDGGMAVRHAVEKAEVSFGFTGLGTVEES